MYHLPVLLHESVGALITDPSGVYVDVTFGGGGHSKAIIEKLDDNGHLFAFDQDDDARANMIRDPRFTFVAANFRYLSEYMDYYQVGGVHGVLADLGVSSWQFDNPERGFSYRQDQALDMRMNRDLELTASKVVMEYSDKELLRLFSDYGQVRNARTLVRTIVDARKHRAIHSVQDFMDVIDRCIRGVRARYLAQVFQSLRIEVNDEMGALADFLEAATEVLLPGGRLVVISYHSVEDQMVKRWMRAGNRSGVVERDDYGHADTVFNVITRKPIVPGEEELSANSRSRSAKLRVAEKK